MPRKPEQYFIMHRDGEDRWEGYWIHQVGLVGYYFGQLEWLPYLLGNKVGCSKTDRKKMTGMTYNQRYTFAKQRFLPQIADSTLRAEFEALLSSASSCSKLRNEILHNPLEVNFEEMNAGGVGIDQGIRLLKKDERILGLGDVQHFSETMMELHRLSIDLLKQIPALT